MLVKYSLDHQDASHYVCIIWIYALEKNRKVVIVYYTKTRREGSVGQHPFPSSVIQTILLFLIN